MSVNSELLPTDPNDQFLRLADLNGLIRAVIEHALADDMWVVAEVAEITIRRGRHCYMTLVQKQGEDLVAQARATVWSTRSGILDEFEGVTGQRLAAGMEVLLRVRVRYHPVYGLSLDVSAMNPEFTLGGLARRRRETLAQLAERGLMERNAALPMPAVPMRIALITSPDAAGRQDFVNHLNHNIYGYRFAITLFAAVVQGAEAERSIATAFASVAGRHRSFDVIALVRGGGSQVDLSCFDSYLVGAAVAESPLPVLTGIGHEKDESVADIVAHTRTKTPTAAAEWLINRVAVFEEGAVELQQKLIQLSRAQLQVAGTNYQRLTYRLQIGAASTSNRVRAALEAAARMFAGTALKRLEAAQQNLARAGVGIAWQPRRILEQAGSAHVSICGQLQLAARLQLERKETGLLRQEREAHHLDPTTVLRRGYSITRYRGRAIRSVQGVKAGSDLATELRDGILVSRVLGQTPVQTSLWGDLTEEKRIEEADSI